MAPPRQLPLGLVHPTEYGRESFVTGPSNRDALALVEGWPNWPQPVLFLSGPEGAGKTHLAHIWAEVSGAMFIPAAGLRRDTPASNGAPGVIVEDIDREPLDESALFHFLNAAREAQTFVLVTARRPVASLPVKLPDLLSRLRLATPVELAVPDETLLRLILVKLFADRQIMVERTVLDYLLSRMERSFAAAAALVAGLDREALASGSAVTRPMAGRVLAALNGSVGEEPAGRFTDSE